MRYVILGKINPEWLNRSERFSKSKDKLQALGVKLESVHYTQGAFDFVDIISTDNPQAALAFSIWYGTQGYGSVTTMPAYTPEEFSQAIEML